jgi:dihydropteridine reductase
MVGYGMAKAAVHHLTKSLAFDIKIPPQYLVVCILPEILYTTMNRKMMPKDNASTWTPLNFVAE